MKWADYRFPNAANKRMLGVWWNALFDILSRLHCFLNELHNGGILHKELLTTCVIGARPIVAALLLADLD
jgi:hypothetical protein